MEHGCAPSERAVSLAQCAFIGYGPTPTSAARRARFTSACAAHPHERERAVARTHVCTRKLRLLVGGRGWHVRARPFTEGEGRPAGTMGWHNELSCGMDRAQPARRGAHTLQARAALPPERERARAVALLYSCARAQVSCSFGGRGSHVGVRPCTDGESHPAGTVGFHRVRTDSNQRGGARARRKSACCASS